ncbi:Fibrillin-1 [Stylophora pistillata]|uniref:Fibrillin-1 n=1 Tax=Stylophora pistillata TaxID=50429 RepID=A0A2B4RGK7_STYPI|nr:Fibrillin-1 [Stylophora pistillata]
MKTPEKADTSPKQETTIVDVNAVKHEASTTKANAKLAEDNPVFQQLLKFCSTFPKIRRTLAYVHRFAQNARKKNTNTGPITVRELKESENQLFKWSQLHLDPRIIDKKLIPSLEEDGQIGAHGRLQDARSNGTIFDASWLTANFKVNVNVTVSNGEKFSRVHSPSAVWVQSVTARGFKVCARESGIGSNGTGVINWLAFQDHPQMTRGSIIFDGIWTTETKCEKVTYLQNINVSGFRVCVKELYEIRYDPVSVSYAFLTDLNECQNDFNYCHKLATCTNERGSYKCKCKAGYVGDGLDCYYSYAGLGHSATLANDDNCLRTLSNWLSPAVQSQSTYWKRHWRASADGWPASTFHSLCDSKGPTVTIIRVGKYIFGGYTSSS